MEQQNINNKIKSAYYSGLTIGLSVSSIIIAIAAIIIRFLK